MPMPNMLVIDDEPALRSVIASTLTRLGYCVRTAENGVAGLRLFEAEPADLVIVDIYMPEKDGIETILALREHIAPPRIIAVSGGGHPPGPAMLRTARLLGADAALAKPFGMADLARAVAELLDPQPGAVRRSANG